MFFKNSFLINLVPKILFVNLGRIFFKGNFRKYMLLNTPGMY